MSLNDLIDRGAVLQAMAEYRDLGRAEFLTRYGFGPSRFYVVSADGWRYDVKAALQR